MADGRSPFSREALEQAGFEVLAFDAVDDGGARAMAHSLEWDLEADFTPLLAHYTLARRREVTVPNR
jgi:hypothetical protein